MYENGNRKEEFGLGEKPRDERPRCAGEILDSTVKQLIYGIDITEKLLDAMTGRGKDTFDHRSPECFMQHIANAEQLSFELTRRLEELGLIIIG